MKNKIFSRDEKINYYRLKMVNLKIDIRAMEHDLEIIEARLQYLLSDDYQDWTSSVPQQIAAAQKGLAKTKS